MARPRHFDEPALERITVRLTRQQRRDLDQVATENQTNAAAVIREAVNEFVADYRDQMVFRQPKTTRDATIPP